MNAEELERLKKAYTDARNAYYRLFRMGAPREKLLPALEKMNLLSARYLEAQVQYDKEHPNA